MRFLISIALTLFIAGNCHALAVNNDKLIDVLVNKGIITEEEASEISAEKADTLDIAGGIFLAATHYDEEKDFPLLVTKNNDGVDVNRAFLAFRKYVTDTTLIRMTAAYVPVDHANETNQVMFKHAFVSHQFTPALTIDVGIIQTAWVDYEDSLWKYRYVSKGISEGSYNDPADAGIAIKGKLFGKIFTYHLAGLNGNGYKNISKTDNIRFDSKLGFYPLDGLTIDLQYKTSNDPEKDDFSQVMTTYGRKNFRIGVNALQDSNKNPGSESKSNGVALWGWFKPTVATGMFFRYEELTYENKFVPAFPKEETTHIVAGLSYTINPSIEISLAWDHTAIDDLANYTDAEGEIEEYGLYVKTTF